MNQTVNGLKYKLGRLNDLIQRGERLLTHQAYPGQLDQYDLWITEAISFVTVNAPSFLEKLTYLDPKLADKLYDTKDYRSFYKVMQLRIEALKEVRGFFEELAVNPPGWMLVRPNPYLLRRTGFSRSANSTTLAVFVVMAWDLIGSVYSQIKEQLENTGGFVVNYAGERHGQVVFEDIWKLMNESDVVLVDFTGKRPSVYLEYGMALVLGKPIVAITQNKEEVPSDTPNLKYSIYKNELGETFFKTKLANQIRDTIADFRDFDESRR